MKLKIIQASANVLGNIFDKERRYILVFVLLLPIFLIVGVLSSPFNIFIAKNESGIEIMSIINNYQNSFVNRIEIYNDSNTFDSVTVNYIGSEDNTFIDNSNDVLSFFSVLNIYKNKKALVEFKDSDEKELLKLFNEMNYIDVFDATDKVVDDKGKKRIYTSRTINVYTLSADEMAEIYDFNEKEMKALKEVLSYSMKINDVSNSNIDYKKILSKYRRKFSGNLFLWPVPSQYEISSPFGMRMHPIHHVKRLHTGIDIPGHGLSVVAVASGTVIVSDTVGSYGKAIIIDHGDGISTLYAHNSKVLVSAGDKVKKGQEISKTGATGGVTGSHLHFEVIVDGQKVNPMKFLINRENSELEM